MSGWFIRTIPVTRKKERLLLAKAIRKKTGMKLPAAVKAAKWVLRGARFPWPPGCAVDPCVPCGYSECNCTREVITVQGLKGTFAYPDDFRCPEEV